MEEQKESIYRSRFEAYPYLCEDPEDFRCDYEILTDELASLTGLLRAQVKQEEIRRELLWVVEIIYHMNPALRTHMSVTDQEIDRLEAALHRLEKQTDTSGFVLPAGTQDACLAHVLRARSKALVRMIYRHVHAGHEVESGLIDLANLLSGYFFQLALRLNSLAGVPEIPFSSRVYFSTRCK